MTLAAIAALCAQILADLEELQSRGFGHQDAASITSRMRVALQQIDDAAKADTPEPPADPVAAELRGMRDELSAVHLAVLAAIEARPA